MPCASTVSKVRKGTGFVSAEELPGDDDDDEDEDEDCRYCLGWLQGWARTCVVPCDPCSKGVGVSNGH